MSNATRRGFLNYVPQVHDSAKRSDSEKLYGSGSLGISRAELYISNFTNANSPIRTNEQTIANAFNSKIGRFRDTNNDLRDTEAGDVENPDFPAGHFNFLYGDIQTTNAVNFNGNSAAQFQSINATDGTASNNNGNLTEAPAIATHKTHADEIASISTLDHSGKYTPNINTLGLNFQGTTTQQLDKARRPQRKGGGFGTDTRVIPTSAGSRISTTTFTDIHDSTLTAASLSNGVPDSVTNIRGDSAESARGYFGTSGTDSRFVLGSFDKSNSDVSYDDTNTPAEKAVPTT